MVKSYRRKLNVFFKTVFCLVLVAIYSLSLLVGTFAKFTTTTSGADTMQVAKFDYEATDRSGRKIFTSQTADIDLFGNQTTNATGTVQGQTINTTANGSMLAPGVYGWFQIVFDNTNSDVDLVIEKGTTTFSISDLDPVVFEGYEGFLSVIAAPTKGQVAESTMNTKAADKTAYGSTAVRLRPKQLADYLNQNITKLSGGDENAVVIEKGKKGVLNFCYQWVQDDSTNKADKNVNEIFTSAYEVYPTNLNFVCTINHIGSQYTGTTAKTYGFTVDPLETEGKWVVITG